MKSTITSNQKAKNPFTRTRDTADDESWNGPEGPNAVSSPVISGLGGLREDGIVGMNVPVGGSAVPPPVDGKRGAISGESCVYWWWSECGGFCEMGLLEDNDDEATTKVVVMMNDARKINEVIVW